MACSASANSLRNCPMNPRQRAALQYFAGAIAELKAAEVIRSHRYLGDIAEFLCCVHFKIELLLNLRAPGHDGMLGDQRVQIKYGGAPKRTFRSAILTPMRRSLLCLVRQRAARHRRQQRFPGLHPHGGGRSQAPYEEGNLLLR